MRNKKFFIVGEDGVELVQFNKHFVKTKEKEAPQGNIFEFFLLDTLKNYILNGKFNPKIDTIRAFLSKSGTFFSIFKKNGGGIFSPH